MGEPTEMNQHISLIIISYVDEEIDEEQSGSQLDSHANMIVMVKHCYIIYQSVLTVNVNVFFKKLVACSRFQYLML